MSMVDVYKVKVWRQFQQALTKIRNNKCVLEENILNL